MLSLPKIFAISILFIVSNFITNKIIFSQFNNGGLSNNNTFTSQNAAIKLYNQGIQLIKEKKFQQSLLFINKALEADSTLSQAFLNRAIVFYNLNQYDSALNDLEKADNFITFFSDDIQFIKAACLLHQGSFKKADSIFTKLTSIKPAYNEKSIYPGSAAYFTKELFKSKQHLLQSRESYKANCYLHNLLGNIYTIEHNYDSAIICYNKAIQLDPANIIYYINLANAQKESGERKKALNNYTKAIILEPQNILAYNNRGLLYFTGEEYDLALKDFNYAVKLDSTYDAALNNIGLTYLKLGKNTLAVYYFSQAIKINREAAFAYYNRGMARELLIQFDDAVSDWKKAYNLGIDEAKKLFDYYTADDQ